MEPPITYLIQNGFVSVSDPEEHSYLFDGQFGSLDYILVKSEASKYVTGSAVWNCNADEPDLIDYNLDFGRSSSLFDGFIPERFSDHDSKLLSLNFTLTTPIKGHLSGWLIGPAEFTLIGNNYLDGSLGVSNEIGDKVTQNVSISLYDYGCENKKDTINNTNAVIIESTNFSPSSFGYVISISHPNLGTDTGGFVFMNANPSLGKIKFCTRVSTWEGSTQVFFRETNFVLSYDLTENNFNLTSVEIDENDPGSFIADVDTEFFIKACQCSEYACISTPHNLKQDENLVMCLEAQHPDEMEDTVNISNFNIKLSAGVGQSYVEYNPVQFGTGSWVHDSLTLVQGPNADGVIMISTPIIAKFFIQTHKSINVTGNCFLEFDTAKSVTNDSLFMEFNLKFGIEEILNEGCLIKLIRKFRELF